MKKYHIDAIVLIFGTPVIIFNAGFSKLEVEQKASQPTNVHTRSNRTHLTSGYAKVGASSRIMFEQIQAESSRIPLNKEKTRIQAVRDECTQAYPDFPFYCIYPELGFSSRQVQEHFQMELVPDDKLPPLPSPLKSSYKRLRLVQQVGGMDAFFYNDYFVTVLSADSQI